MKKIYSYLLLAGLLLIGAQNAKADYCVAGTMTGWSDGSAMVFDSENNYYYTEFNDHMSGAQQFKIKVVGDGSWNPQWNASNIDNTLGNSTITLSGTGDGNINFTPNGRPYVIYFSLALGKVWACDKVISTPIVSLEADKYNQLAGENVTLTATAENFSGAVTYAYSYSTDGGTNYTPIATTASNTQTFTMGASGTAYKFKVVATYNTEESTAVIDVNSVVVTAAGAFGAKAADAADEVFGTAWAPANDNNDMAYSEGVFTWSKEKLYLSAGTILCKVVYNHSWDINYPNDNVTCAIDAAGYYDVTITFNWSTNAVSCVATYLYPKVVIQGGTAIGTFELENLHTEPVYLGGTKWLYTVVNLAANEYTAAQGFKMSVNNGTAQGLEEVLTRINCSRKILNDPNNACGLRADIDGEYTFRYIINGDDAGKLTVDYPQSFTREIPAAAEGIYQTLCVPFMCSVSNAEVYTLGAVNENTITLTAYTAQYLTAGKSYIIKPTGGDVVVHSPGGGMVAAPVNPKNKATGLYGNLATPYTYVYNTEATKADPWYNNFVLQNDNMFHQVQAGGEVTINSTRAYLHIDGPEITNAPALRIIETATNIENIEANEDAVKFMENGKLYIKKNGVIYNAVGAIVK